MTRSSISILFVFAMTVTIPALAATPGTAPAAMPATAIPAASVPAPAAPGSVASAPTPAAPGSAASVPAPGAPGSAAGFAPPASSDHGYQVLAATAGLVGGWLVAGAVAEVVLMPVFAEGLLQTFARLSVQTAGAVVGASYANRLYRASLLD